MMDAEQLFERATEGLRREPVSPADEVERFLQRFVSFASEHQPVAVALWIMHTYCIQSADATPYISVSSPAKRSGKTRLLETLEVLVARPWYTGRTTAAVLVRKLATDPPPTLLLDESDAAFQGDKDYAQALRAVLNLGHRRGGKASLCVGQGANIRAKDFPVFGAKAIAGIGHLPDTVEDRSIPVRLVRRAPGEHVERFRWREVKAEAAKLREDLSIWTEAMEPQISEARPSLPEGLSDRAMDGWEPLLAIADAIGGQWPRRARDAALYIHADATEEERSRGELLLAHIQDVFKDLDADRISTADLLTALMDFAEGPWPSWWGRAVRDGEMKGPAARLARLLREFGIRPKKVKIAGTAVQGYERSAFDDAWSRYVPSPTPQVPTSDSELGTSQVSGGVALGGPEANTPSDQAGSEFRLQSRNERAEDGTPSLAEAVAMVKEVFPNAEEEW